MHGKLHAQNRRGNLRVIKRMGCSLRRNSIQIAHYVLLGFVLELSFDYRIYLRSI